MATSLPSACSLANQVHLVFRGGLGEEVIDAGFARDGRGGQRIVAGDHDGPNAHGAQLIEAFVHSAFDDVFQVDHAQRAAVLGDHQGRAAGARNLSRQQSCTSCGMVEPFCSR